MPDVEPFALVEKGPHGLRISAVNEAARAAGIVAGASLPDVRAALPALGVKPAEGERDRSALEALARWLGRYGPASNVDGVDGAWVDVTGVPHLFGGEPELCADLADRLRRLGLTARIGLADTLGAAHALARFATRTTETPWSIAGPAETRARLADLPVAALRIEPDASRLLVRLGLKRIGQLYGLPRAALATRFRDAGRRQGRRIVDAAAAALLLRLDQTLGLASEPRRPLRPPPEASSRLAFPEPLLAAEGVAAALERLARMLSGHLESQSLGARRFRLSLYRTDGTVAQAIVGTRVACRDPAHICRLMAEKTGGLDAGFGIDVAILEAGRLEALCDQQTSLEATRGQANDPDALIDRLATRLGASRVRIWAAGASHVPEHAERWHLAMDGGSPAPAAPTAGADRASQSASSCVAAFPDRRPPLLLTPPEPIAVIAELPEGAPQRFIWRRLSRRIVKSEGPERIAPEWWRHIGSPQAPGVRDYYRLEDATGARYWVFREGLYGSGEDIPEDGDDDAVETAAPRWFVHGLFA